MKGKYCVDHLHKYKRVEDGPSRPRPRTYITIPSRFLPYITIASSSPYITTKTRRPYITAHHQASVPPYAAICNSILHIIASPSKVLPRSRVFVAVPSLTRLPAQ
ncbi:hypothetical protein E2C01_085702 [Portunus trituberculatus]|uniref:Uncharacterized protein n=1 Tax=Portunus trituberculatus TaxID=210409 RepID=A0A5B7J7K0_PORTR|nr:hypothetical protein [Portunus trituberculatus]